MHQTLHQINDSGKWTSSVTRAFETTEHYETFTVNAQAYASDTLLYDANGNNLYDGQQVYQYDAWNRLLRVAHGYRDAGGNLQSGGVIDTFTYDALSRRTGKTISTGGTYLDRGKSAENGSGTE